MAFPSVLFLNAGRQILLNDVLCEVALLFRKLSHAVGIGRVSCLRSLQVGHKLNSRAWANPTDPPIIAFGRLTEFQLHFLFDGWVDVGTGVFAGRA